MSQVEKLEELRKPFPDGTVGVLPKPYKRDSPKAKCSECGGFHGLPAAHLDFVGHAAVTDRLLSVDLGWEWEPFAVDPAGLPALDREGNLWIRLTVCGVTRIGVGDGPNMKERIGDAIRNAAMRFGVALSLWTKDELESGFLEAKAVEGSPDAQRDQPPRTPRRETHSTVRRPPARADTETGEIAEPSPDAASQKQLGMIAALFNDKKFLDDRTVRHLYVAEIVGREFKSTKDLTRREASKVIEALMAEPVQQNVPPLRDGEEAFE